MAARALILIVVIWTALCGEAAGIGIANPPKGYLPIHLSIVRIVDDSSNFDISSPALFDEFGRPSDEQIGFTASQRGGFHRKQFRLEFLPILPNLHRDHDSDFELFDMGGAAADIDHNIADSDRAYIRLEAANAQPWTVRRDEFLVAKFESVASESGLIADKSCLALGSLRKAPSEPSDNPSGDCGSCPSICIQPSQNNVKPIHTRYDWLLALAAILSPFIAGFFAIKGIRDLNRYINRNTQTIDKY